MNRVIVFSSVMLTIGLLFALGCGTSNSVSEKNTEPKMDVSEYLLSDLPEGALDVKAARELVKDRDAVVVLGRIGGAVKGDYPRLRG